MYHTIRHLMHLTIGNAKAMVSYVSTLVPFIIGKVHRILRILLQRFLQTRSQSNMLNNAALDNRTAIIHLKRERGLFQRATLLGLIIPLLGTNSSALAEDASKLASELARLRAEVETLTGDLDTKKEDLRVRLRTLASQKAELEMEIQREELRLRQLRESQSKRRDQVSKVEERKQALHPVLQESIDVLWEVTQKGLPFKLDERLEDIDRLKRQLKDKTLSTPTVLSRLWSKVEDENRLASENGIYKQVIILNGEEMLVDVARIGMVMLFFKTKDNTYGRAVRTRDGWEYRLYKEEKDRQRVAELFDSLEKRIRVGFFEIPPAFMEGIQP